MADKKSDILDKLIQFIENEREIYGDFSTAREIESEIVNSPVSEQSPEQKTEKPSVTADQLLTLEEKLKTCSSLDQLRKLCAAADELKTDLENTNLVFGVGNPNADLMLIGEAPGEQEDIQGEPFVGPAGQLLNKILKAIDFERGDIYIANILKHRPPGNRNPNEDERARSLPYLMRQIDLINPKIILCLGKVAGLTLLNKDTTLRSIRGKFHEFKGIELTVTYHPAALLRNPKWKRPTWEDVQMVRKRYDELGGKP